MKMEGDRSDKFSLPDSSNSNQEFIRYASAYITKGKKKTQAYHPRGLITNQVTGNQFFQTPTKYCVCNLGQSSGAIAIERCRPDPAD